MRQGASTSLITLDFATHSVAESHNNPRVPSGFPYSSVKAKLSELDFIFLNRFVQEILQYISVLLVLRPPPIQQQIQQSGIPALATSSGVEATQAESEAASDASRQAGTASAAAPEGTQEVGSVLQLEIDVEAPVISMPRTSDSQDSVQLDLGYINVHNSLEWFGGSSVEDPKVCLVCVQCQRWVCFLLSQCVGLNVLIYVTTAAPHAMNCPEGWLSITRDLTQDTIKCVLLFYAVLRLMPWTFTCIF